MAGGPGYCHRPGPTYLLDVADPISDIDPVPPLGSSLADFMGTNPELDFRHSPHAWNSSFDRGRRGRFELVERAEHLGSIARHPTAERPAADGDDWGSGL